MADQRGRARPAGLNAWEQAAAWIGELRAHCEHRPTRIGEAIASSGSGVWSVLTKALNAVGPEAVPLILEALEGSALEEEFNDRGSPAWEEFGAFTPANTFSMSLMGCLAHIGVGSEEVIVRLVVLLQALYDRGRGKRLIGTNLVFLARALHRLRHDAFPEPAIGASDNHLLNWRDFGLVGEDEPPEGARPP